MFKLVISDDEGKTTVVPLVRDEITIGRKEGNTIRLTERNVSRRHARLFKGNGAFTIEDLGSYNGIKLNGRRIAEASQLKAGDQVTIGDYLLALQVEAAESASEPTTPLAPPGASEAQTAMIAAPTEPVPPARLIMLSPPAPGAEFALSRPRTRFGRAEDLDAWLNHRSISREHAEVVQEGDGHRIVDLGSANGLRVNGQDTRDALLGAGDVVEMGQVRFRYVGRGETYVFDADRTIQMEAVPPSGSRAPLFAALGIIVVAIAIGGMIAIGGADDEPVAVNIDDTLPGEMGSAAGPGHVPQVPATPASLEAFAEALRDCRTALEEERFGDAVSHGGRAVSLDPNDASAQSCKADAQQALAEREIFDRGKAALASGDVDAAYFAFEELPEDSPFRETPEVRRASERFARDHLRQAQAALRRDPEEAARHASMILTMSAPPEEERREAETLRRAARRRGTPTSTAPVRRTPGPTEPTQPRVPRDTGAAQGGTPAPAGTVDPLVRCRQAMAQGGSYTQCIIQSLEGRARTARELEALIESYRASGNQPAALRHMQNYVRRYPSTSQARNYQQILSRHGIAGP